MDKANRKSLEDRGLNTKLFLSAFFMFVVPVALAIYIYNGISADAMQAGTSYTRILVFWMIASGAYGYILSRNTMTALMKTIEKAKDISEGKTSGKIEIFQQNELKDLAVAFNRLTDDLENKLRELEYSRNLTRELFEKIGYAITSSQKIEDLFNLINQNTRKVFAAEASFIVIADKDSKSLKIRAYAGPNKNIREGSELPQSEGLIREVMNLKKPIALRKPSEPMAKDGRLALDGEPINYSNILCVPILDKNAPRGAIAICNLKNTEKIDSEDLFLMETIASQISVAMANLELTSDIEKSYFDTLITLARAVEAKDKYSAGHLERVSAYAEQIADKLHLDDESKKTLKGGAILHDLGKLGISDAILNKEGKYTQEEFEIMKKHTIIGENILKPLKSMAKLSDLVRHHHEHFDGTGYPDGLKGSDIPVLARILAVADVYDALTTERSYKRAMTREESIRELNKSSYNKFDPKIVKVFLSVLEDKDKEGWQ